MYRHFDPAAGPESNATLYQQTENMHAEPPEISNRPQATGLKMRGFLHALKSLWLAKPRLRHNSPRWLHCAATAIGISVMPLNATHGQTPSIPDSALRVILEQIQGTPLSLDQARQYALKNAAPLLRAEASYLAARGSVRREKGAFDPELFFDLN